MVWLFYVFFMSFLCLGAAGDKGTGRLKALGSRDLPLLIKAGDKCTGRLKALGSRDLPLLIKAGDKCTGRLKALGSMRGGRRGGGHGSWSIYATDFYLPRKSLNFKGLCGRGTVWQCHLVGRGGFVSCDR